MSTRESGGITESRLELVSQELAANNRALQGLEEALRGEPDSQYLLKKYERLSKREELLLEERKLWAGAALQNHSWQAGLLAAPGVKALLSRLVLASSPNAQLADFPDVQQAITAANIAQPAPLDSGRARRESRRYNTRHRNLSSPDKAQLMLLANAADASEAPRSRKRRRQTHKLTFGARFKPFHVAKLPEESDGADEGAPVEVPVHLSLEDRLAEYARQILEGPVSPPEAEIPLAFLADALPSESSRESREGPGALLKPPSGLTGIELTGSEGGAGALPPRAESVHEPLIHLTPEASTADELDALASSSQMGRSEQVVGKEKPSKGEVLKDQGTADAMQTDNTLAEPPRLMGHQSWPAVSAT